MFPHLPWARCPFHLQQSAQAYVPRASMRAELAPDLRGVFNAADLPEVEERLRKTVESYRTVAPAPSAWMQMAVPEGRTVFGLPEPHRRWLRRRTAWSG